MPYKILTLIFIASIILISCEENTSPCTPCPDVNIPVVWETPDDVFGTFWVIHPDYKHFHWWNYFDDTTYFNGIYFFRGPWWEPRILCLSVMSYSDIVNIHGHWGNLGNPYGGRKGTEHYIYEKPTIKFHSYVLPSNPTADTVFTITGYIDGEFMYLKKIFEPNPRKQNEVGNEYVFIRKEVPVWLLMKE